MTPPGDFLTGKDVGLVDCSLAPKLYHLDVAVGKFHPETHKKLTGDGNAYPGLNGYMESVFAQEAFKSTRYPAEVILWGWEEHRKATGEGKGCAV